MRLSKIAGRIDVVKLFTAIAPLFGKKKRERFEKIVDTVDGLDQEIERAEVLKRRLLVAKDAKTSVLLADDEIDLVVRVLDAADSVIQTVKRIID